MQQARDLENTSSQVPVSQRSDGCSLFSLSTNPDPGEGSHVQLQRDPQMPRWATVSCKVTPKQVEQDCKDLRNTDPVKPGFQLLREKGQKTDALGPSVGFTKLNVHSTDQNAAFQLSRAFSPRRHF